MLTTPFRWLAKVGRRSRAKNKKQRLHLVPCYFFETFCFWFLFFLTFSRISQAIAVLPVS
jgi:hypothetical protein